MELMLLGQAFVFTLQSQPKMLSDILRSSQKQNTEEACGQTRSATFVVSAGNDSAPGTPNVASGLSTTAIVTGPSVRAFAAASRDQTGLETDLSVYQLGYGAPRL
jgi:hypothetical protein